MLDLDANVIWLAKCTYLPGYAVAPHVHPFFHYIYIINGSACINVGNKTFSAHEDEFYLIPKGASHGFTADGTTGFRTIEMKFAVNGELMEALLRLNDKIHFTDGKIRHMAESLINEGIGKAFYYDDIINIKFIEILLYLLRYDAVNKGKSAVWIKDNIAECLMDTQCQDQSNLRNVLSYMEMNMDRRANLDMLAKISKMGKFNFDRVFKRVYGITPIQYFNNLRVTRAKELMSQTEQNITQIAQAVGFDDVHYFSRFFKQKENIPPNEYMKKVRGSLYIYLGRK